MDPSELLTGAVCRGCKVAAAFSGRFIVFSVVVVAFHRCPFSNLLGS